MRSKVVFVEDSRKAKYGGGQRMTELLVRLFHSFDETVLVDVKESILSKNCVHNCLSLSYPKFFPFIVIIRFIQIFFFDTKSATVVCCTKSMLPLCVFGKFLFDYRLVYYAHTEHKRGSLKNDVALWCAFRCDRVICVSHFVSQFFEETSKVRVIHNPILPRSKAEQKFQPTDFYYIGAMTKSKGVQVLLDVASEFEDITLSMIGVGELFRTSFGSDNVIWLGFQNEPIQLIPKNGILILPSIVAEACPMVLLEAASNGINFVTTNFGGQLELASILGGGLLYDGSASDLRRMFESFRDGGLHFAPFVFDREDFSINTFEAKVKEAIYE